MSVEIVSTQKTLLRNTGKIVLPVARVDALNEEAGCTASCTKSSKCHCLCCSVAISLFGTLPNLPGFKTHIKNMITEVSTDRTVFNVSNQTLVLDKGTLRHRIGCD